MLLKISLINFHLADCGKIFSNEKAFGEKEKKVLMIDFLSADRDSRRSDKLEMLRKLIKAAVDLRF